MNATAPLLNCALCDKPTPLRCGACEEVGFCSREHQKILWKSHKWLCGKDSSVYIFPPLNEQAQAAYLDMYDRWDGTIEDEDGFGGMLHDILSISASGSFRNTIREASSAATACDGDNPHLLAGLHGFLNNIEQFHLADIYPFDAWAAVGTVYVGLLSHTTLDKLSNHKIRTETNAFLRRFLYYYTYERNVFKSSLPADEKLVRLHFSRKLVKREMDKLEGQPALKAACEKEFETHRERLRKLYWDHKHREEREKGVETE